MARANTLEAELAGLDAGLVGFWPTGCLPVPPGLPVTADTHCKRSSRSANAPPCRQRCCGPSQRRWRAWPPRSAPPPPARRAPATCLGTSSWWQMSLPTGAATGARAGQPMQPAHLLAGGTPAPNARPTLPGCLAPCSCVFEELRACGAVELASSEEQPVDTELGGSGYSVAFDPLDGSSIIGANWAVGSIFSVWPGRGFLGRQACEQVAAAYAVYGPKTVLVLARPAAPGGQATEQAAEQRQRLGVQEFVLLPDGTWQLSRWAGVAIGLLAALPACQGGGHVQSHLTAASAWFQPAYFLPVSQPCRADVRIPESKKVFAPANLRAQADNAGGAGGAGVGRHARRPTQEVPSLAAASLGSGWPLAHTPGAVPLALLIGPPTRLHPPPPASLCRVPPAGAALDGRAVHAAVQVSTGTSSCPCAGAAFSRARRARPAGWQRARRVTLRAAFSTDPVHLPKLPALGCTAAAAAWCPTCTTYCPRQAGGGPGHALACCACCQHALAWRPPERHCWAALPCRPGSEPARCHLPNNPQGGGVFCNPTSASAPAKLRCLYETFPLALLTEAAGGASHDGSASGKAREATLWGEALSRRVSFWYRPWRDNALIFPGVACCSAPAALHSSPSMHAATLSAQGCSPRLPWCSAGAEAVGTRPARLGVPGLAGRGGQVPACHAGQLGLAVAGSMLCKVPLTSVATSLTATMQAFLPELAPNGTQSCSCYESSDNLKANATGLPVSSACSTPPLQAARLRQVGPAGPAGRARAGTGGAALWLLAAARPAGAAAAAVVAARGAGQHKATPGRRWVLQPPGTPPPRQTPRCRGAGREQLRVEPAGLCSQQGAGSWASRGWVAHIKLD